MRRRLMGIIAIVLLASYVGLWFAGPEWNPAFHAACGRVGLLLGALWLALPELERVPAWLLSGIVLMSVLVAVRPKFAPLALVIVIVVGILRKWSPAAGSRRRK